MGVNSVAEENSKMSCNVLCEKAIVGRNMAVGENVKVTPKPHGGVSAPESQPQAYYYAENITALATRYRSLFGDFDIGLFCKVGRALGSCEFGTRTGIGYDDSVSSAAAVKAVTAGLISSGSHVFDFGRCFLSEVAFFSLLFVLSAAEFTFIRKRTVFIRRFTEMADCRYRLILSRNLSTVRKTANFAAARHRICEPSPICQA